METLDKVFRISARKFIQAGEALGFHNLDPDAGKILITGGTGVIGHRVAQRLLDSGRDNVRLGCHNLESLEDCKKLGAEVVQFDWNKEDTYIPALTGIKSVLCTIPYQEGWSKHFPAFLKACQKAGVKHIVKISFCHANVPGDVFQAVSLVREHSDCDDQLINMVVPPVEVTPAMAADADVAIEFHSTPMSYTILHASHFMSNPFIYQGKDLGENTAPSTFFGASHDHGVNYVSPNDVAEACVRCLLEPRAHYDKEYTITGPGPIKDQQVAGLLSEYLKKPVLYVDQPPRLFTTKLEMNGEPKWKAEDLAALEEVKASGEEEKPSCASSDFERICGHPPETFEDYLRKTETMVSKEAASFTSLPSAIAT